MAGIPVREGDWNEQELGKFPEASSAARNWAMEANEKV